VSTGEPTRYWRSDTKPDVIIGDMDSVSEEALRCGAVIVVHAYADGKAPGAERLEALGVNYVVFASVGTSEDIAMLLAYERGADLIVAVGTHNSMVEFLDKGPRRHGLDVSRPHEGRPDPGRCERGEPAVRELGSA